MQSCGEDLAKQARHLVPAPLGSDRLRQGTGWCASAISRCAICRLNYSQFGLALTKEFLAELDALPVIWSTLPSWTACWLTTRAG